jgi:hypothetical protein
MMPRHSEEVPLPEAFTIVNLAAVHDTAPENGFGDRWEARVARTSLKAEHTGVTHFRLRPFTHPHSDAEENYVVLSGSGRVKLDGRLFELAPRKRNSRSARDGARLEAGPAGVSCSPSVATMPATASRPRTPGPTDRRVAQRARSLSVRFPTTCRSRCVPLARRLAM